MNLVNKVKVIVVDQLNKQEHYHKKENNLLKHKNNFYIDYQKLINVKNKILFMIKMMMKMMMKMKMIHVIQNNHH